ncbi:hypothetical protein Gotur_026186 [Gossypium turneri]
MGWLCDTFPDPDEDSTEIERIRYARAYILQLIGGDVRGDATEESKNRRLPVITAVVGTVSLSISTSSSGFSLITRWNHPASHARLLFSLEDIRLLLDQRSEAQDPWQAVFTDARGEAAANTCRKGKARASKSKTTRRRRQPLNEAQTFTWLIISGHAITRPNESTDAVTRRSSSTDDTHATAFSDDANPMTGWSQMFGSAPFPVMPSGPPMYRPAAHEGSQGGLWIIVPSPTTRCRTGRTRIPSGGTTTAAEAKEMRNPARNRRRPPCGTESPDHRH